MREFSETARTSQRRSGTMMRGAPAGGAVGSLVPDEPTMLCPALLPMLPVVEGPPELDPTVPVTGAGIPALPVPVPKFGVTVVLPGPLPPGTPAPERGTWAGVPGWPGPDDVEAPGEVPPLPAAAAGASATVEAASRSVAVTNETRTGMGRLLQSDRCSSTAPIVGSFRPEVKMRTGDAARWAAPPLQLDQSRWCGREDSNLHGLPR